jgi:hypothetical protein
MELRKAPVQFDRRPLGAVPMTSLAAALGILPLAYAFISVACIPVPLSLVATSLRPQRNS